MDELVEQLKGHIIRVLRLDNIRPENIDSQAPIFKQGLGLDSIDALELIMMLEREYGIRITSIEEGWKAFASVQALADFIRERRDCTNPK
jgi:acyl carrier protein